MSTFADQTPPAKPEKPAKPAPAAAPSATATATAAAAAAAAVPARSVADIIAADAEDESLRKYKESLLGAAAKGDLGDVSDPRRVVITEFRVMFEPGEGHEDMVSSFHTFTIIYREILLSAIINNLVTGIQHGH